MQEWLDNNDVLMYYADNEGKSVIAERFMKTLKAKIYKNWQLMTANLTYLNKLVDQHNNAYRHSNNTKPTNADYSALTEKNETNSKAPTFKTSCLTLTFVHDIQSLYIYITGWPKKLKALTNIVKHCITNKASLRIENTTNILNIRWIIQSKINFTKISHNLSHNDQDSYLHYQMTWETNEYAKQSTSLGIPYH